MATPEIRPEVRRDPGIVVGQRDAAPAGADAGRRPGGAGSEGSAARAPAPKLINGQLALTEPRCGGRLPGKGMGVCMVSKTCARYTQMAKDRASPNKDWQTVPVWWTCSTKKIITDTPGYVHDEQAHAEQMKAQAKAAKPKRHPWKGKPPQDLPKVQTRDEKNRKYRERLARTTRQWGA